MASELTTLAAVKARLQLPPDVTDQDPVIDAIRLAIEEKILDRTGFTFEGGVKSQTETDVQIGVTRTMRFRPIIPMSSDPLKQVDLQARSLASATFNSIIGEIKDSFRGKIIPLASELTPIFPPIGGQSPWFRWRQMYWPVVVFSYLVDPLGSSSNPIPRALSQAAIEWTAAIYGRGGAMGALKSISLEAVTETYIDSNEPAAIKLLLARYNRDVVVIATS